MEKSEEEWRKLLSEEEFLVTRKKGTERPFSGKYYYFNEKGDYLCVCCGAKLFDSTVKYDSGSGWPSFYDAVPGAIKENRDTSHGMIRVEIVCASCNAHLGHVFDDGPKPTGLRYCVNSLSLKFKQ